MRDWLANNLDFIEKGLKLIKKEYPLPDQVGAKGFIDLLCTDAFNNFVIIELKVANTSSRQTFTEIFKYHSLIKHNFKARESEIKIIILSTHWNELIRAYSTTLHRTTLSLIGYDIKIANETAIPFFITLVKPLPPALITRKFAYWKGLYLFIDIEKRKQFHEKLFERLSEVLYNDYIIMDLDGPKENKKIETPFSTMIAFQRQSKEDLLQTIDILNSVRESDVMERKEFDDDISYHKHLEGAFIDALDMVQYSDDAEAGYSEKLDSMLNAQGWIVVNIERYGIFKIDPRYNDSLLLKEVRGHDGNNRNKFSAFAESTQLERMKEVEEECKNSLLHTTLWLSFIEVLFKNLD